VAEALGDVPGLAASVRSGDTRALARAISLVEDDAPQAQALVRALFPHAGRSLIVGVTGPPGAGKSSLVDRLTALLRGEGRSVGIVAVDPSSPARGGAVTAESAEGEIMALRHQRWPVVGLQFHPEAVLTEHGYDLLRNFLGDAGSSRNAAE